MRHGGVPALATRAARAGTAKGHGQLLQLARASQELKVRPIEIAYGRGEVSDLAREHAVHAQTLFLAAVHDSSNKVVPTPRFKKVKSNRALQSCAREFRSV